MKSCVSFHWCFHFQSGAGLNHKQLDDKEAPLFIPSDPCLLQNGVRHKLTKMILLLPWKLWNTHPNFIITTLHFVLVTKIFWNYLLRTSQQIYASRKQPGVACSLLTTTLFSHKPGRITTHTNAPSCCLIRHPVRMQNLSWKVWG